MVQRPPFGSDAYERLGLAPGARLVVGASGGVDSTVLLRLLHAAGFRVAAAHVNYGLRGADADADETFVRALAEALGVPCHVRRVALPAKGNKQAAARAARYGFLQEVAEAEGAEAVAVGHTQDDQAETVLLNLTRGAGLRGLAGMPLVRRLAPGSPVRLIRPLLDTSRAEVEALARASGWTWRDDASNASDAYRRNRLRRHVLPVLRAHFGESVSEKLAASAAHLRAFLDGPEGPPALLARLTRGDGRLDLGGLRPLDPSMRRAVLLEALCVWAPEAPRHAAALAELDALLDAQPGRRVVWPGATVWRDREAFVFESSKGHALPAGGWPVVVGRPVATPLGLLTLTPLPAVPEAGPAREAEEIADADALAAPLVLRPWRAGDRFRPLGAGGTKRVSDLLTERKVPPSARAQQLVLCAGDAIVWVVGHRLAEAARVGPDTRAAVRLTCTPAPDSGAAPPP